MTTYTRRDPRYAVEVAAEITVGSKTFAAATQNISEGGVGLILDQALAEGTAMKITLFLTQDGIEDPEEDAFEARANVAWTTPGEGGKHTTGVRFGAITPDQREHLQRFIGALAAR